MKKTDNEKQKSEENNEELGESVVGFLLCFFAFLILAVGLILAGVYFVH